MLSNITRALCIASALGLMAGAATAQDPVKIGLILPMTGPFTSTGKQITAAVHLYMQQHGDTVAGRKVEVILRDDAGNPESTKRLAQDLIVNSQASLLAGFGLTPLALVAAPLATQAKVPEIIMAAGTSIITERSPFIVRTSFTVPQSAKVMAEWAAKNNIKTAVTMVTDYAPGHDAESSFTEPYKAAGGQVLAALRVPLQNPDFAPFLQRAADAKPDALFVFVPSGPGAIVMKQYVERGMDKAGIKMIAPATLLTTTSCRATAMSPLASSLRISMRRRILRQPIRPTSRRSRKAIPECGRTSCRSAAMTACISSTPR